PSALVATSDAWLRVVAAGRGDLDAAYRCVLHPPNPVLDICLSKERFTTWCESHGLPVPARYRVGSGRFPDLSGVRYPVLLRPAETRHSNPHALLGKAVEARSASELTRLLDAYRRENMEPVLCQSLLGRRLTQYSVGLARDGRSMM